MPRWSFPMTHVLTGDLIAEHIPFSDVKFSDTLDNGGVFSARFPVEEIGKKFSLQVKQDLWRYMVWPCRYGVPMGAYILTSLPNEDLMSPTVSVQGKRFDAIFARRHLRDDLVFVNQDQLSIARDLIRYAAGVETVHTHMGGVTDTSASSKVMPWLQWGQAVSGVYRTITTSNESASDSGFDGQSGKSIADLLRELSELGDEEDPDNPGFEYRADYGRDTETAALWARMTLATPTVGRGRSDPKRIVFEFPSRAVTSASYGADGEEFATRVRVIGRERDGKRPSATKGNSVLHDAGYPLLDHTLSSTTTTETLSLAGRASARLRRSKVTSGWSLTLDGSADPTFGTYRTGDHVIFRPKRLGVRLPDTVLRITGWDVDIKNDLESVTPQVAEV